MSSRRRWSRPPRPRARCASFPTTCGAIPARWCAGVTHRIRETDAPPPVSDRRGGCLGEAVAGAADAFRRSRIRRSSSCSRRPERRRQLDCAGRTDRFFRCPTIGLGPIKLPEYLDRDEVVTRVGPNRLELSDQDRWAEPLDNNFKQVIAQDLTQSLGTHSITFYPWAGTTRVDYQVRIDVYRFETDPSANAQLVAHWQVLDGSGKLLYASDSNLSEQAQPGEPVAAASKPDRRRPRAADRVRDSVAAASQAAGTSVTQGTESRAPPIDCLRTRVDGVSSSRVRLPSQVFDRSLAD